MIGLVFSIFACIKPNHKNVALSQKEHSKYEGCVERAYCFKIVGSIHDSVVYKVSKAPPFYSKQKEMYRKAKQFGSQNQEVMCT